MSLQVLHYSEEKIGLSQQIYDYVDQKIRRLDRDLKNFEGDIARERTKLGLGVRTLVDFLQIIVAASILIARPCQGRGFVCLGSLCQCSMFMLWLHCMLEDSHQIHPVFLPLLKPS